MGHIKSEYEVEAMLLDRLQEMGYEYIDMANYDNVLANFRNQLEKLNADALVEAKGTASLSDAEFSRVLLRLEDHTVYDSAALVREQYVLDLDNGEHVYMDFLSEDPTRNRFQVTHQITMDKAHKDDVEYKNRYDVTVLVNGLPLVQIELKRAGIALNEAINQINRYRRYSFKGLFRCVSLFIVSNGTQTKYFANANETFADGSRQDILKSLAFYWTDEHNTRIPKLIDFTDVFMQKTHLTQMLTKFFVIKATEPILMVMRPYQIYAVKSAYDRIIGSKMDGFVFHTTGSGKTLTSYRLSTLLRDNKNIDKVFFLIDRSDLDDQTVDEYNSFEEGCVDNTTNTKALVEALMDDDKTLIITTIQKMATALRKDKYAETMAAVGKKRCVFIIDECHRSQFGKMHADIRRSFTDANYIGFTGTPIFEENKSVLGMTTADVFATGSPMVNPCIHRYMIKEAIADGNVLRFSVEFMKTMEKIKIADETYSSDEVEDPEWMKAHGYDLEQMYHEQTRIELVADDILENLEKHTHPEGKDVYTAIFASDRIPTLMRYYRYMRSHNPKNLKIAAIFTYRPNEDLDEGADENSFKELEECMEDYNCMFGTSFDLSTFDGYRKDISKRLKQKELPQLDLLLVVDMFLTGFDSKPTNTLILDKNLAWHNLVQAYSRTNRVDKVTKQFGQVISYRNIKKAQDAALKLYSGNGNPDDYLLESYEYYVADYRKKVEALRDVCQTADDAASIQDEDEMKRFVIAFRNLAHTLSIIKTFSKFQWTDLDPFMDEEEYGDYKSWYLDFHDQTKHPRGGKTTVLADIDFEIELVRTDKINVVYILNLLKDLNRVDMLKRQEGIDLILREIERSDNEKLRLKKDILKEFVTEKFFEIDPSMDITLAYEDFEKEHMKKSIYDFAEENGVGVDVVSEVVTDYMVNPKVITRESVRQQIVPLHLGLLKTSKLVDKVMDFAQQTYDIYTTEEE